MRSTLSTALLALFVFLSSTFPVLSGNHIPCSSKSQTTYRRVAPRLNKEIQKKGATLGDPVFIRIFKQEHALEIWLRQGLTYTFYKAYSICAFSGNLGPKLKEGDKQSPEGFYTVGTNQLNPNSDYHLSFNLGFPNEYDRCYKRTGSLLMIHGGCSSAGCFAMTNYRMEEIYAIVESAIISGQQQVPIHIFPFKMTAANMTAHRHSKWIDFWENLKEGYDYFEGHQTIPLVTVANKRYHFSTFLPLLFGGTLPKVAQKFKYAGLKKQQQLEELARKIRIEKQQKQIKIAMRRKAIEKRQGARQQQPTTKRQRITITLHPTPSALNPLGLGD